MTLNTAYFELAEAIWNNDHEEMMVDHENTLQRLASMKLRMDGLKAVCLRLLNQRMKITWGHDEAAGEMGYFIGSHFCGPDLDTVVEYLLSKELG